jgi:hypothetical protein
MSTEIADMIKNLRDALEAGTDLNDLAPEIRKLLVCHDAMLEALQEAEPALHALVDIQDGDVDDDDIEAHVGVRLVLHQITGQTFDDGVSINQPERHDPQ